MQEDLAPVRQEITVPQTLGYKGLAEFDALQAASRARVEMTTRVGFALAKNGFRIFEEKERRGIMKQATRSNGRLRAAERRARFRKNFSDDNIALYAVSAAAFTAVSSVTAMVLAKLLLWVTSGWSANLPVLLAGVTGAASGLILALSILMGWILWNFTSFRVGERYQWYRIPIASYLPPLISADQLTRLEELAADLTQAEVQPIFYVYHGTADEEKTLIKKAASITEQAEQLQKWRLEVGLIELRVVFEDGETHTLTISRTY